MAHKAERPHSPSGSVAPCDTAAGRWRRFSGVLPHEDSHASAQLPRISAGFSFFEFRNAFLSLRIPGVPKSYYQSTAISEHGGFLS